MSEANGSKPVFDFTHYSHKEARALELEAKRLQRLDALTDDPRAFPTEAAFEAALAQIKTLVDAMEAETCKYLVDLPREWLVPEAPEGLDWSDPASLVWIRQDRFGLLRRSVIEALQPEQVSKNLARR